MTKTYLDPEEVRLLEDAATNPRDRLLIRLLFRLGCRIDLEHGTATILHLKTRLKVVCPHCNSRLGRVHAFCPGCGQKVKGPIRKALEQRRVRTLHLDSDTLEMMRRHIQQGGPVFRDGKQAIFGINRHRAWQITRDCARRAGLPSLVNPETGRLRGVSPHRLRDAFAVHAVKTDDTGDGLRLLQEQLGHSSFNTTAKYRKVAGDELKEWYSKLWNPSAKTSESE